MAVRFKFRSSSTFDLIDIGNRPFISIRDLKSEIVKKKHLNLSQDFDLLFSDSLSGQEYKDENVQIPSGSSVIIKRVPATSTPLLRAEDVSARYSGGEKANHKVTLEPPLLNDAASDLEDFGIDLCSLPDANILDSGKLQSDAIQKKDSLVPRCSDEFLVRCHKLDAILPSQATPKDSSANEGSTLVLQSKPKADGQVHLESAFPGNNLATERSDMPSELKCSLCRNFLKEAVMIPCCQHSFCEKCIRLALAENSRCPMCFSTKCKAEDLLPNVALRQAIEHFLESQLLLSGSENNLHRYAPDGESGIQVKELSLAASVMPRDVHLKRSNHIMQNQLHNHGHMQCDPNALEGCTEFQGENDPQNMVRVDEEASCNQKEDGRQVVVGGEARNSAAPVKARNSAAPVRLKRGLRTCYMCGSPDHLIRECPVASSSRTNHWQGDATFIGAYPSCPTPYWPGTPPNVRPFLDMYGGPGLMMYNATVPTIPSFAYPSYPSSMYPVYPAPSGHMKLGVGGMAPPTGNNGLQPSRAELLQTHEKQHGNHNGNLGRDLIRHQVHEFSMRHDDKGKGMNRSDENFARRSEDKYKNCNNSDENRYSYVERQEKMSGPVGGRDLKVSQSDRSTSEKDTSDSRIHYMEDRHEKIYRSSRISDERRARYEDDDFRRESTTRRRECDHRKSDREYQSHSRSSKEQSYSGDGRQRREESSHRSRHPKRSTKSIDREFHHDQEKKTKHSDADYGEYYHSHKRKRCH